MTAGDAAALGFLNSAVFWAAWVVIPVVMEVVPAVLSVLVLLRRRAATPEPPRPARWPEITVIVPVYNSAATLGDCLASINGSTYPNERIQVYCADNGSTDKSSRVFDRCEKAMPDLAMSWMETGQGKSRALNAALYQCESAYVVHLDSDGVLEPHALANLIAAFEADPSLDCVTGAVLVRPDLVARFRRGLPRLLRRLEFCEYAQAFLAGRNAASETGGVYTISGAFSAFRNSAIKRSWLYNTETVAEDTQITSQMRYVQGERVRECPSALFLVDPVESLDKLYTQRQRWQRGSLEVARLFAAEGLSPLRAFTDVNSATLLYDHTFAFPRMIWYLALGCLLFMGYSGAMVVVAAAVVFGLYILCGYLYFFVSLSYLRPFKGIRDFYRRQWWVVALLPFFNLLVFFIRLAGIVNSVGTSARWRTSTLTEERGAFVGTLGRDWGRVAGALVRARRFVNARAPREDAHGR